MSRHEYLTELKYVWDDFGIVEGKTKSHVQHYRETAGVTQDIATDPTLVSHSVG